MLTSKDRAFLKRVISSQSTKHVEQSVMHSSLWSV